MSRVRRGIWSRRGVLVALVAMTTVVVAGAVTVTGYADAAGASRLTAAPLLLLGVVAVPALGRELAASRRGEIGLARLRGIEGRQLVALMLAEPALAIAVGLVLGTSLGVALLPLVTSLWLERGAGLDVAGLVRAALVGLVVAGLGLLAVMAGAAGTLREALSDQVRPTQGSSLRPSRGPTRGPRASSVPGLLGGSLAIVGAVVAVYRGQATGGTSSGAGADLLVLLGPALVGLALGQVAVWVLRASARAAAGRVGGPGGLAGFLASRRAARAEELTGPVRLVVAAGVVGLLAASAGVAAAGWSADQARVELAGPVAVSMSTGGAVQALAVSHRLDPAGDHLMAAVLLDGRDDLTSRRGYVDAARWEAVGAPTLAGSDADPWDPARVADLVTGVPVWAAPARRLEVEVELLDRDVEPGRYVLDLVYVSDRDSRTSATVPLQLAPGRPTRVRVGLPDCSVGCQPVGLMIAPGRVNGLGSAVADVRRVRISTLRMGAVDLLDASWMPGDNGRGGYRTPGRRTPRPEAVPDDLPLVRSGPLGLDVVLVPRGITDVALSPPDPVPALAAEQSGTDPVADFGTVGGDARTPEVVAREEALPLVGEAGTLSDLTTGVWASAPTLADAEAMVVASPDAPASLVEEVAAATGGTPVSLADRRRHLAGAAGSARAGGYGLMAGACLLVALVALAVAGARHERSHRLDVASLRTVGVPVSTARAAGRLELGVLAVVVATAVVAGGWLGVRWLLPGLPLVQPPPGALAFEPATTLLALALPAVGCAVAVVLLGGRARRVRADASRPAILREDRS